jgi:hypothetical protein
MVLHAADADAVAALAVVFPAMAATGGYTGTNDYPNGKLVDEGHDLLDIDGGVSDGGWHAVVWHENNVDESLEIQVGHTSKFDIDEGRTVRTMVTTVSSKVLGYESQRTYRREIKGKSWKAPRINGRREVAKAVAQFLADVTSPEAIAERAERAALRAEMDAASLARATTQWELAVIAAVSITKLTETEVRDLLDRFLNENGGPTCWSALTRSTEAVRAQVAEKFEKLTHDEQRAHLDRIAQASMALHRNA